MKIFITGAGIISPLGRGLKETINSIKNNRKGICGLTLFESPHYAYPAGEIRQKLQDRYPRTHALALAAAEEALLNSQSHPDAVVIGVTTGGMPATEEMLKRGESRPELYRYHSTGSVADVLARETGCSGPAITVSTACSSGAVAVKIAIEMLKHGKVKKVLAGGADSICRLTYFGFNSLQLIDPEGAKPFDRDRLGMTVAEGAAMLLLVSSDTDVPGALAELTGAGLSCDAYHPAAPHPEGAGAMRSMKLALDEAGLVPSDIDYINLHGTGTKDNDLSEAKAVHALFGDKIPLLSSIKGASGHSLGAAGAIESVISMLALSEDIIPANTGYKTYDPEIDLRPVISPLRKKINTVQSNSFGFGGNNASLILCRPGFHDKLFALKRQAVFQILGSACITGAGCTDETAAAFFSKGSCKGMPDAAQVTGNLSSKATRRLKRLSRMALSLSQSAYENSGLQDPPASVFFGTGWGPLSETNDFLKKIFETDGQFASPTDFIGSVHNAPAGQIAIQFGSTGMNITTTGGDYSFEQALMSASLLAGSSNSGIIIAAADEFHEKLSILFDASVRPGSDYSDGGGALVLKSSDKESGLRIFHCFYESAFNNDDVLVSLINSLGGSEEISSKFRCIFAGIPLAFRDDGEKQLSEFLRLSAYKNPVVDYRKHTGEYPAASAAAAVLALRLIERNEITPVLCSSINDSFCMDGKGILMLGLGDYITAYGILQ